MNTHLREIIFKNIYSLIDCMLQSMVTIYVTICVLADQWDPINNESWAIYGLYFGFYLGVYQLIHAIIQTIKKRHTFYFDWLLGYWAGIGLLILFVIVTDNDEDSFNFAIKIPLVLAIYYCVLTWRIAFQKKVNEY